MSNSARFISRMLAITVVASILFCGCQISAQSANDLPPPGDEPWLAEPGNYYADFNEAQIACYAGSMEACDLIGFSERILMDTWLSRYGRTCGGRVDLRAIMRANLSCTEVFPGH